MTEYQASARRTTIALPTYPIGPANKNPIIKDYRYEKPYPYRVWDNLKDHKEEVVYDALVIENEYLAVTVVPKFGAKLYSAYDKRNGQEVFYKNRVVKPQLVGLTGAWTSGGIEFNFPRAHRPSTMEEIETDLRENGDGSASIFLGETDKTSGLRFTVELRLYPGKSYIEQRVNVYNPTMVPQRFYFWNTSSYPETEQLECRYPAKWMIEEQKRTRRPWPYEGGADVRKPRNATGFATIFTSGDGEDFFGVYDRTLDRGTVHVASHREMPGKKLWAWGMSGTGRKWNDILTDEDGPYVEYQAGNVPTQMDFTTLRPGQQYDWSEYWFQAVGTGAFTYANRTAIMTASFNQSETDNQSLRLSFTLLMNESHGNAKLELTHNGAVLFAESGSWTPDRAERFQWEIPHTCLTEGTLKATLSAENDGECLVDYEIRRSGPAIADIAAKPELQRDDDTNTLLAGIARAEGRNKYRESLRLLDELLSLHPLYVEAYVRKAVVQMKMYDFDGAQGTIQHALRLTPFSDELHYYGGLANYMLRNHEEARQALLKVSDVSAWAAQTNLLLGKIAAREGAWRRAEQYFAKALDRGAGRDPAAILQAYALAKLGNREAAATLLRSVLREDPIHITASAELDRISGGADANQLVRDDIHNALYILHFYDEIDEYAAQEDTASRFPDPAHPLLLYHAGCLKSRLAGDEEAVPLYLEAERKSPDWVFPITHTTLAALTDAVRALGDRAVRARYYLGLIYNAVERFTEAEQVWQECVRLGMDYSILYRNLGYLLMLRGEDELAAEILEQGLPKEPYNTDIVSYLNTIYKRNGAWEKRTKLIGILESRRHELDELGKRVLVGLYNDFQQFDKAIDFLKSVTFRSWEIEENRHIDLKLSYRVAFTGKAKQLIAESDWDGAMKCLEQALDYYPNTNLALAAGETPVEELYLLAMCHEKTGNFRETLRCCGIIADTRMQPDSSREYEIYVKALGKKVELEWLGL